MERLTGWSAGTSGGEILKAGKAIAARLVQSATGKRRMAFASAFATVMTEQYWKAIQVGAPVEWRLPKPFVESDRGGLDERSVWLARAIGRAAAEADPVTAGYFIGTTYAAVLPPETRASFGVYYTPPAVAARLLDQATAAGLDWNNCTVLDPACGGGAFLAPVAQRIVKQLSHLEPEALLDAVASRVRGFEIDPVAAWMSQVFLEATVLPTCRAAKRRLPVVVSVRDTLASDAGNGQYDLVIGNPPYGRVTLSTEARRRYSGSLYGHANLYGVFTDIAQRWVCPGGLVAYVTPTSFLAGEYFKNLRRLLGEAAPPVALDFIANRKGVFDDVLQEALLATYRRGQGPGEVPVSVLTPADEVTAHVATVGTFTLPDAAGDPWLVPRSSGQAALIRRMRAMPHRLFDWGYSVSTGPLVWNRHKSQLRRETGDDCLPIIWSESISADGRFRLRSMKQNHKPYVKLRGGDDWLVSKDPCVLLQRTTAKEQTRRLVAAVLPASLFETWPGVVVENHLNMVRPRRDPALVDAEVLAAFLNSRVVDEAFRCLSGSVAVSAYELEALPMPGPGELGPLIRAVKRNAGRDLIDAICMRLYGIG